MYQKFGIMLLLIVCSLGSSLVFVLLNRHKKEERKHVFWFFSFIFVWNFSQNFSNLSYPKQTNLSLPEMTIVLILFSITSSCSLFHFLRL